MRRIVRGRCVLANITRGEQAEKESGFGPDHTLISTRRDLGMATIDKGVGGISPIGNKAGTRKRVELEYGTQVDITTWQRT